MRVVAVDLGSRRIGLAVGEVEARVATPRAAIRASGSLAKDAREIVGIARAEEAQRVVVGVPEGAVNSPSARASRTLAQRIAELGWPVDLVDESLTTVEALDAMAEAGLSAAERRRRVDSEAACRILDLYFDSHEP
jgi:putative Holliday junction resolvase